MSTTTAAPYSIGYYRFIYGARVWTTDSLDAAVLDAVAALKAADDMERAGIRTWTAVVDGRTVTAREKYENQLCALRAIQRKRQGMRTCPTCAGQGWVRQEP
jgi:hypothetical protein